MWRILTQKLNSHRRIKVNKSFWIGNRQHGIGNPYIIAEIGVNHEGSLRRALSMIDLAVEGGAHAVKFQTYKATLLAAELHSPAYWDTSKETTTSQFELFSKLDSFEPEDYKKLSDYAVSLGVDFLSTPFDLSAVEMLDPLVPMFKIASADITNVPLIRAVAKKQKPIIISAGAANYKEIEFALNQIRRISDQQIFLLHCVLNYPTDPENANLLALRSLQDKFGNNVQIGYSDHVAPDFDDRLISLEIATILGSVILEKHFTDNRNLQGNDHYHSTDQAGLKKFTQWLNEARPYFGNGDPNLEIQVEAIKNARRKVFSAEKIVAGQRISENDVIALRADTGIGSEDWDTVIGSTAANDISKGSPILMTDLI